MLLGEAQRKIQTYDIVPDIGELPEKKPKTKIELTNKRTRNSTRYINPDGSFTEEIYNQPIFYQDISDKKWKRIDYTLKKDPLAPDKIINTANEFKSIFAEESDISKLVSVQEVRDHKGDLKKSNEYSQRAAQLYSFSETEPRLSLYQ